MVRLDAPILDRPFGPESPPRIPRNRRFLIKIQLKTVKTAGPDPGPENPENARGRFGARSGLRTAENRKKSRKRRIPAGPGALSAGILLDFNRILIGFP